MRTAGIRAHSKFGMSRRTLLSSAPLAVVALLSSEVFSKAVRSRGFEHGNPLREFRYSDVRLADCPQQAQLEQTHAILMGMNEDSLLRPYRLAAGLPAPGFDLGGWYSATPERAGIGPSGPETFGQWISALSRSYAITGDIPSRNKIHRLLDAYGRSVEPQGRVFRLSGGPAYFYDKLACGLNDAYRLAGERSAPQLLARTTAAAIPHLPGKAIDQLGRQDTKSGESYTIPENQFIAWIETAEDQYLLLARQYLANNFYFDPLAHGQNVLPGRHAYSHVNALSSAAKAYLVFGDEKYLKAAVNGFRFIEEQSYATGGWGPDESFLPRTLTDEEIAEIRKTYPTFSRSAFSTPGEAILQLKVHFETGCGSYAHFKLTRYLLRITKDPHYGDSMERVMYNCSLGALPLNKFGKAFYQSDYSKYATKQYFDGYGNIMEAEWPCCSGTLPQLAADYHISAYFRDERGVFVNLYIPSALKWIQGGAEISLTQKGEYPLAPAVNFTVETPKTTRFSLRLRIPEWAIEPSISINGEAVKQSIKPGTFADLTRDWKNGDQIELCLPARLELKPVDEQHPGLVALVHGPIVLFAIGYDLPKMCRDTLLSARQKVLGSPEWTSGGVRFLPWWVIKDEVYTTYHDIA